MKYLKYLLVAAIAILTCSACSEKNELPEAPVGSADPDYLVLFYGIGGDNIDGTILSNVYMALDAGTDDNVQMTFQLKMSPEFQEAHPGSNGTRRFTGEDNTALKGTFKAVSESYPILHYSKVDDFFAQLKTEKIGGADYNMTCADSLTAFIKWSKDKYPTAKRTILVMAGHGHGWSLKEDGVKELAGTRGILTDKNNSNDFLSLNATVTAVKNAGNVDVIYNDACMMCMYENLYGYAECAKYCLASFELTPSLGGNYTTFINLLKEADSTDEGLEKTMQKYCDHCLGGEWWSKDEYSDLGFYNLTKLDNLTKAMKDVVDTMVGDDKNGEYISKAFLNCEIVDTHITKVQGDIFHDAVQELMKRDEVNLSDSQEVLHWIGSVYQSHDEKYAGVMKELDDACEYWADFSVYSFSFADLLRNLDNALTEAGVADNPYSALRKNFLTALKEVAYIRCTTPKSITGIDPAYELCSPGIFIIPFTLELYEFVLNTNTMVYVTHVDDAKKVYQNTAFDKQVKWSRMLDKIDVFPSILYNLIRSEIK